MAEKRKTTTSTAVKMRYNNSVYDRMLFWIPKEDAAAFREKCAKEGIPMAQVVKKAISDFIKS